MVINGTCIVKLRSVNIQTVVAVRRGNEKAVIILEEATHDLAFIGWRYSKCSFFRNIV